MLTKLASYLTVLFTLCALSLGAALPPGALIKLADSATPIPSGNGNFTRFRIPVFHSGHAAFAADGSDGQAGIYLWNGTALSRVADLNTPVPNGSGNFTNVSFFAYAVTAGQVAFAASGVDRTGLYLRSEAGLTKLLDSTDQMPGAGNFTGFGQPAWSGSQLAFYINAGTYRAAVVLENGLLSKRHDNVGFGFSSQLGLENGTVASWVVTNGAQAIIASPPAPEGIRFLATTNTLVPAVGTPFRLFRSPPVLVDGQVVFFGTFDGGGQGFYRCRVDGTGLERLVDNTMPAPGLGASFSSLLAYSYADETLVFGCAIAGVRHLFRLQNGAFDLLLSAGDLVDGREVTAFDVSTQGQHGGTVVVGLSFKDNTGGIYLLEVGRGAASGTPTLGSVSLADGKFQFTVTGTPGQNLTVEFADSPAGSGWQTLTNFIYGELVTIESGVEAGPQFFRARGE